MDGCIDVWMDVWKLRFIIDCDQSLNITIY